MKLRRLLLRSFGCLRGEYHFSADRLNLLLEPNEKGKSTLAEAILAGLYGFPTGQRRSESRPFTDIDLHRPWDGGEYLVEMDVEVGGRIYTVRRDFANREERVYEWRTGKEITGDFQASKESMDFAGKLTGLTRDEFSRTVFLRQSEMTEVKSPGGITAALQRAATSQTGDVAAAEAIEVLEGALRQYRGRKIRRGKIDNEIAGIEEEIRELTSQIEEMEDRRRRAEERILELEETSREESRNEEALKRLEYLILASGRKEDAARLEEESREAEELRALEEEFKGLEPFATFPADGHSRLLDIRARLAALDEEEERGRERLRQETQAPLQALEEEAKGLQGFDALESPDPSDLSEAETDLAAAFRARREARRALRKLRRELADREIDTDRLRALSSRFSSLTEEDREFLRDYGARAAEARSELSSSGWEAERTAEDLADAERALARSRSLARRLLAAAVMAAVASVALAVAGLHLLVPIAAALAAVGLGSAWLALRPRASAESRVASLREQMESVEREGRGRSEAIETIRGRLEKIAATTGMESPDRLLEEFRQAESRAEEIARQDTLVRQLQDAVGSLESPARAIRDLMERAGYAPRFATVTPRTARLFRDRVTRHGELRRAMEEIRERRAAGESRLEEIASERSSLREEASGLMSRAGIEDAEDLDGAISGYEEGLKKRERFDTLKRDVIPGLVRRSLSHRGEELRHSVELADQVLRRRREECPGFADLDPEKPHKEYVEERDRLRQDAKSLVQRRLELSNELGEVLREYRRDYPDAQRWLREWTEHLERVRAFRASVSRASEVLETLSREAYAEWADVLNERASEVLKGVVPGYDDLRFDEDLSFTVRDRQDGSRRSREDVDYRFSAGTRDQIYLAARLAVAEYLSSGRVKLPLILDDPFASFDDERFASALSLLLTRLSRRHQIILFSCQEARHRAWQDRNARLSAERIRVMTLQTYTA